MAGVGGCPPLAVWLFGCPPLIFQFLMYKIGEKSTVGSWYLSRWFCPTLTYTDIHILFNKGIILAVLSEFGNTPRLSHLFTRGYRIGDIMWRIHLRAFAGYDDIGHALFSKLVMILSMWLGLASRKKIELAIDKIFRGKSPVEWK